MKSPLRWHERALIRQLAIRGFPNWLLSQRFGRHRSTITVVTRGARPPQRPKRTPEWRREYAVERRRMLTEARLCINSGAHGPATHGVRCAQCAETHRRTA